MTDIPSDISDNGDRLANDDPSHKKWHLKFDNYNAARRALYAARAQLD